MNKGDSVALTGRAKLSTWQGKDGEVKHGIAVTAEEVMSAYTAKKKRAAGSCGEEEE